jgi:transcriptional regulator with XRE-family HTH domain
MQTKGKMKAANLSDTISFGDWVQQRRLALDLTRPALARQVHCSPSTIKKIERDERRPSRQIAALLANHLLIPEYEQEQFVQMARGEFVTTPLPAPDLISLPPFLRSSQENGKRDPTPLVAREGELAQLVSHLETAVAGDVNIVFITGEAGDGKTMLAQAFARGSQEKHPDLVVAIGN